MSKLHCGAGAPPLSRIWLWCIIDADQWQVAWSPGYLPHCHWPLAPVALLGDPLPEENTPSMLMEGAKTIRAFESTPLMCFQSDTGHKKNLPISRAQIIRTYRGAAVDQWVIHWQKGRWFNPWLFLWNALGQDTEPRITPDSCADSVWMVYERKSGAWMLLL